MSKVNFEVNGIEYTFKMGSVDGAEVLTATYTQNGESHTIWTAEATSLPESEEEATDYISDFDWAVEQSSALD